MNKLESKKAELAKIQEEIKQLEEQEKKRTIIEINGWEYETQDHDFNLNFEEASKLCPKGWELWTYEDCIKLHNNLNYRKLLNLEDCWFYVVQPFEFNKDNNLVAWFDADSVWAYLYCYGSPSYSDASLGVRFKRKILKVKK